MLDCISGGRLVAGFPTGLPADAVLSNGVVPIEQRERYREALALVIKAWSAKEVFAWNGKHYQLGMVNLWPRPIQQPHPPIWIPGAGISGTADYVVDHDHCFCHLSYYGLKSAEEVSDRYWDTCARKGRDDNPYRYSFLQLIGVADTDAEAERIYGPHGEYFFNKLLYIGAALPADPRLPRIRRNVVGAARHDPLLDQPARTQGQGLLRARLHRGRQPEDRAREAARRRQAAAHRASADAAAFRLDADRPDQAQHRPVRARGAAASRPAMGRQVRGPLVARTPARQAPGRCRARDGRRGPERTRHGKPSTCAGSSFGRTGSRPKWRSAARVRRWSGCMGRGG